MEQVKSTGSNQKNHYNPIKKMIEDKKMVIAAIKNGESISNIKGIKVVNPL
jgi:hypothetical protein